MKRVNFCLFLTFLATLMGSCVQAASSSSSRAATAAQSASSTGAGTGFKVLVHEAPAEWRRYNGNANPDESYQDFSNRSAAIDRRITTDKNRNDARANLVTQAVPPALGRLITSFALTTSMRTLTFHSQALLPALFVNTNQIMNDISTYNQRAFDHYKRMVPNEKRLFDLASSRKEQLAENHRFILRAVLVSQQMNNNDQQWVQSAIYPEQAPTEMLHYVTMASKEDIANIKELNPNSYQFCVLFYSNNTTKIIFSKLIRDKILRLTEEQCQLITDLSYNESLNNIYTLSDEKFATFNTLPVRMRKCLCTNYRLHYNRFHIYDRNDHDGRDDFIPQCHYENADFLNNPLIKKWHKNREVEKQELSDADAQTFFSWLPGTRQELLSKYRGYRFTYKGLELYVSDTDDTLQIIKNSPLIQKLFKLGQDARYELSGSEFNIFCSLPDHIRERVAIRYHLIFRGAKIYATEVDDSTLSTLYYTPHKLLAGAALAAAGIFGLYKLYNATASQQQVAQPTLSYIASPRLSPVLLLAPLPLAILYGAMHYYLNTTH